MIENSHAKDMRSYHMFPWFFYRIKKAVEGKEKLIEKNEKNNFALSIACLLYTSAFGDNGLIEYPNE